MKLAHLLEAIDPYELEGETDLNINGLSYDSRKISEGDLFVAIKGSSRNGHDYLPQAIENGAAAAVVEEFNDHLKGISLIKVTDSREALSQLAARFYDYPFKGMEIVGITGTNGKTTTSYILESILRAGGKESGVIGTINYRFKGKVYPSPVTTPESLDLMCLMRDMADNGVTHLVMEVSSHALDQKRTGQCPFRVGILTNISRDHLDYHRTMDEYFHAKSILFRDLCDGYPGEDCYGIINRDDPRGEEMAALTRARILTYGVEGEADFKANLFKADGGGIKAEISTPGETIEVNSPLLGKINIYNILAATAAAYCMGIEPGKIVEGIANLKNVPGRLEPVLNRKGLSIVVDYAHTPDALEKAQENLRPLITGKLITVFGCGGDRDQGKRFEMGLTAGKNSDIVIITSDNPRSEDPLFIIGKIEEGVKKAGLVRMDWNMENQSRKSCYFVEENRRTAIKKAVSMAEERDLVLIAGKGHEDYQIVGTEIKDFDDRKEAAQAVNDL
jgi:UDP-N-acetylmuramoyl-L-alanyl-D-glutamate--2,6-diaminopimelate ligase